MKFETSVGKVNVDIVKNDYDYEKLPVSDFIVQGICDAFLGNKVYNIFSFYKRVIVTKKLREERFYGFKTQGYLADDDFDMRFNSKEFEAAVEVLKQAGYHFHYQKCDGVENYKCSKYPRLHGWTPIEHIVLEDDFNDIDW